MERLKKILRMIFCPKFNRAYAIRVCIVAVLAFLFFRYVCKPVVLDGGSMEPNYHSGTLNFCWTPAFRFHKPKCGDVVVLKFGGDRVMLLKRIVAVAGDTVEFRSGFLFVNGKKCEEPYVRNKRALWNLSPRKVEPGNVYVVGDNRSMPLHEHKFGQIHKKRIMGTLLL